MIEHFINSTKKQEYLLNKVFETDNNTTGFVNNGWTLLSDSIQLSGTYAYNKWFYYNYESFLDNIKWSAKIRFNDTNSIVGIFKAWSLAGTYCKIDLAAKKLIICQRWDMSTTPVDLISQNITQEINSTDTYIAEYWRNGGIIKFSIKNENTKQKEEIQINYGIINPYTTNWPGSSWGKFGIALISGDVNIYDIKCNTPISINCDYAFYGDSITEGGSLMSLGNNFADRWCAKLRDNNYQNSVISGQGGANSEALVYRFRFDFQKYNPKNTVIFIGANDTQFSVWQTNVQNLINQIIAKNSIPILCSILPIDSKQAFINQANAWILNSGYKIFDFAYVLTVNNDRVTRRSDLFLSDNVHPNIAGHEIMYQECLAKL